MHHFGNNAAQETLKTDADHSSDQDIDMKQHDGQLANQSPKIQVIGNEVLVLKAVNDEEEVVEVIDPQSIKYAKDLSSAIKART